MNVRNWLRYSGLAAMWGGVLAAGDALFAAAAYYNQSWSAPLAPGWARALTRLLEGAFTFASPEEVYRTYGRAFLPALLLLLAGALGLQACCLLSSGRAAGWGYRLTVAGLLLGIFGNLADYWLGPQALGQAAWVIGFVAGTELGMLLYLAGAGMMARRLWREGALQAWQAAQMALAPLLGLALSVWGLRHIPGGFLLPVGLSWVLIGLQMWARRTRSPAAGRRAR